MATAKTKPSDFTGRQREALAEANIEEQQKRASELSLATAEATQKLETEVLDATKPNVQPTTIVVEEVKKVDNAEKTVVIRVSDDIESMTLGAGNYYSFKKGQKYEVSVDVADYLESKGYLSVRF